MTFPVRLQSLGEGTLGGDVQQRYFVRPGGFISKQEWLLLVGYLDRASFPYQMSLQPLTELYLSQ
jgi:hypothetical protein